MSADLEWMDWMASRKLIKPESRQTLLGNTLVLIAPLDATISITIAQGFDLGRLLGNNRLAVGEVNSVPAGKYGKEALQKLGMWAGVETKLAQTDSVRAALALVARGEASFGIVYATDARAERKVKVVGTFPSSSHTPILYPVALTATSANPDAAALVAYLRSPAATGRFTAEGFSIVPR
jgi:molybdate transport system substrate-binding protein